MTCIYKLTNIVITLIVYYDIINYIMMILYVK